MTKKFHDILQGDILAPYLFIICQDFVLWTSIDLMKKMALHWKRQEAYDTLHEQLRMSKQFYIKQFSLV